MKRYPFLRTLWLLSGLASIVAWTCVGASGAAQTQLSVSLGFENRTTPGRYAPVTIEVQNLATSESAQLQSIQPVGNEWRGEAEMRIELAQAIQSDGEYTRVLPVYDPANPITFELLSSTGEVLATAELDLRDGFRAGPYPVYDRTLPRFDEEAALVDVATLPRDWWAYDSAESVWIASALSDESWDALTRWVLAGGSLVVLTGSDFYRMDTPALRALLPVDEPTLAVSSSGASYLSGTFDVDTVVVESDEGFPLLIQAQSGAGTVSLVTVRAGTLSTPQLADIAERVPTASLMQLDEVADALLGAEHVTTLSKAALLLLIGLGIAVVIAATILGRWKERWGWGAMGMGAVLLSVLSGIISNPAKQVVDVYIYNTQVSVITRVGIELVASSLYSRTDQPFQQAHAGGLMPILALPRSLRGVDSYSVSTGAGATAMSILSGEVRSWHAYAPCATLVHVHREDANSVQISNYLGFEHAWMVIDGHVYPLDVLQEGTHTYPVMDSLGRLPTFIGEARGGPDEPVARILDAVRSRIPIQEGVWLVAGSIREETSIDGVAEKVRDLSLVIAQDWEATRAN